MNTKAGYFSIPPILGKQKKIGYVHRRSKLRVRSGFTFIDVSCAGGAWAIFNHVIVIRVWCVAFDVPPVLCRPWRNPRHSYTFRKSPFTRRDPSIRVSVHSRVGSGLHSTFFSNFQALLPTLFCLFHIFDGLRTINLLCISHPSSQASGEREPRLLRSLTG